MTSSLLELCGFEPVEIEKEQPRIRRAFNVWGIGDEDISRAEARVKRYFDLELTGVRKFLGIWIKEFTDLTLAKEEGKKIVYSSFPPVGQISSALAVVADDVYSCIPETIIMAVMGQIFGKLSPILEEAEKYWLPPGQANCPLLQTRLGAILKGVIPVPDLLIPTGTACDQAGKTDEMIQELYGSTVAHLDSGFITVEPTPPHGEPERVKYVAQEMRNLIKAFRQATGHDVPDEIVQKGMDQQRELRSIFYQIQELLVADPIPLSTKDFGMVALTTSSYLKRVITEGPEAGKKLIAEVKERTERGIGVVAKGAPRVTIVLPHYSDPAVTEVIENAGLAIAATGLAQSTDRLPTGYESMWENAAELTVRTGLSLSQMLSTTKALAQMLNPDGIIINTISKCRVFNVSPLKTKEVIEKELGIPVLAVEHDPFDSRDYSPEWFRARVEPFAEVLKRRKTPEGFR